MKPLRNHLCTLAVFVAALSAVMPAAAWELNGTHRITMHSRDGQSVPIGAVSFRPAGSDPGERFAVTVQMDYSRFKDYFLSMKEFKCLEGPDEIFCHVPYPYPNPGTVTATDLAWLEHALMFMFKAQSEFGAKLWNGVYYKLTLTGQGLTGRPQAIDLNQIGAPPADTRIPPYGPGERSDIAAEARWFNRITIE
jgi:hypothetical protein